MVEKSEEIYLKAFNLLSLSTISRPDFIILDLKK